MSVDHHFRILGDHDVGYFRAEYFPSIAEMQEDPKVVGSGADTSTTRWNHACDEGVSGTPVNADGDIVSANAAGFVFREKNIRDEDEALADVL